MSTSLIATPADYCQNNGSGLRGRRWSVNPPLPQNLFGSVRAADSDAQNESAIEEDEPLSIELPPNQFAIATSPTLPSPLSNVYMSGYSTNVYIPRHQGAGPLKSPPPSGSSTPFVATPQLPPSTPVDRSGSIIQLIGGEPIASPPPSLERLKRRLACAYFVFFLCGWGDGVTGTVLPYLKAHFQMSDLLTSGLFCGGTIGFFLGTFIVEPVMHALGLYHLGGPPNRSLYPAWLAQKRGRTSADTMAFSPSQSRYLTLVLGSVVHSSFFVLMGIRQGFGAMFVAYATAALARAFLTASLNEFLVSGPKEAMGYAYALWSIGGVFAPLVCQSIIVSGAPWQNFYYGSLVVSAINFALVLYAFRPTQRELFIERKEALSNASPRSAPGTPNLADDNKTTTFPPLETSSSIMLHTTPSKPENTFRRALCLSYTWAFAFYGWLECGNETVAQGYTVSYLLAARNADPKTVGYVTSGFAGGLSVGRLLWGYFSPRLTFTQQKYTLNAFIAVALVLHVSVLVVNSSLQNSIATAIIGLMYGPLWPGALTVISQLLPGDVRMMVMAIFSAAGNLGTSVFPLIIGVMSSVKGMQSMPYLMIPQTVAFLALWAMFPSKLPTRSSPN